MRWRDTSLSDIDRVEAMYHHIKVDIAAQPIIDDFYSEVEEAFEMAKELKADSLYTRFEVVIGLDYSYKMEYSKGLEYLLEAPKYKFQAKETLDAYISFISIQMLSLYPDLRIDIDSLIAYELNSFESYEDYSGSKLAVIYSLKAYYHTIVLEDFPEGIKWLQKARNENRLSENRPNNENAQLADAGINFGFGTILYKLKQYDDVFAYVSQSIYLASALNQPNILYDSYYFTLPFTKGSRAND